MRRAATKSSRCRDGNFQDGFGCTGCLNDHPEKNEDENVVDHDRERKAHRTRGL